MLLIAQVFKAGDMLEIGEANDAGGAGPVLGDDEFGFSGFRAVFVVIVVPIEEEDKVGVLFEGTTFP